MITQKLLERAKYLLEDDFVYYYNARLEEAEHFKEIKVKEALISFEKGKKVKEAKNKKRIFSRDFLLKLKHQLGEEHFWKYLSIRIKEAEEDNDLRNYLMLLINCKPDIKKLYKTMNLEEEGNKIFKELRAALKRLGIERAPLRKISKYFETVKEIPKISWLKLKAEIPAFLFFIKLML